MRHQAADNGPLAGVTVLLLEDDMFQRATLSSSLRGAAATVLEATSGEEAIRLMEASAVQVLVTDLRMAGVNGLDVLAHLLSGRSGAPVRVVVVTAHEGARPRCSRWRAPACMRSWARSLARTLRRMSQAGRPWRGCD
ncbi:response regulator [Arenibaculum pallidiluteum]|uniref:response regulator n=1 Tax=Arenibaculum pallidiluteum TaxID=2812559 RepID=UPI001A95ECC2|nr:response regulator [Arenibaculum pallidiluteum]